MQTATTATNRRTAMGLINAMPANRLPYVIDFLRRVQSYEEVEPDDWDMALLNEAGKENDGAAIVLEQLAEDLGIAL